MEFKLFQYVLPLAMFVSCSDSSEVIPDVPEKLTFDKYEIACFEPSTKKDPVDTLFVSPMAAVSDFDVTIRRQVLSDRGSHLGSCLRPDRRCGEYAGFRVLLARCRLCCQVE